MASYPGVYRAKAVSLTGTKLTAYIPQVFGNTAVVIQDYVGQLGPTGMGWVAFHGGNAEMPVWFGAEVLSTTLTQYVKRVGDTMTGPLKIDRSPTGPNIVSNKTGVGNVDGAIHMEITSAGTQIGRITRATSGTAGFLTSSDEELKENFTDIDDDLAMLWMRTIRPWFFNYIEKPDVRHVGYSAQQVARLWPNAVNNGIVTPGWGDIHNRIWDDKGNETTPREVWQPWMMDHSKITPILHACSLALDHRIISNTQRIVALEQTVATQATQISALQTLVATQGNQIVALQQLTATHTTDIATNTTAIATLRTDVFNTRRFVGFWNYNVSITAPPQVGQIRTNTANTTAWIHKTDADGYDRASQFTMLSAGVQITLRDTTGDTLNLRSTGAPVDSGTYYTITTTVVSATGTVGKSRVEITMRTGIWATDTPP